MSPTDDRDPIDVLAEEFADRLRRGEHPSVSDYAAAHPDHADQLRDLLPAVAQMETLKRFRRTAGPEPDDVLPDRFGDFRIVRELGRGGMGVVFEAVQESLGRPVALKVLPRHAQLDKVRRERFVREAHAAARLHHTNIVPVFGVGEQGGLPYYVMQLIRGDGLHAVVNRWRRQRKDEARAAESTVPNAGTMDAGHNPPADPDPCAPAPEYGNWAFVAEVGLQAADALHYAHKQGVLHRDVKPANLILDPNGRAWVADFGLAKLAEHDGLTATGDILGTLQYLPPEGLAGAADERGDVYGLGATLYELLTLESPYPADSPARLVKLLADTDPRPPRQLNPAIPLDLETIVLKAMAREPAHRYASAREMAADLQAFLEDRPIRARRQTALGRAWRWCRRNPAVASLSATAAAAVVLAGVVGWVGYAKTSRALEAEAARLTEANQARADAEKARADAVLASDKLEANLRMSLESFEKVFDAAGGNTGFGGPGFPGGRGGPGGGRHASYFVAGGPIMIPLPPLGPKGGPFGPGPEDRASDKAAVLEAVLAFYDKFAERNETNPRLQLEAARASRRTGEVHAMRGDKDKAATSFRRAAQLLETLCRKFPENVQARGELIETYLYAPPDLFPDAEALLVRALGWARGLENPPRPNLPGSLLFKIGWVREQAGDRGGAEAAYRDAIAELATPRDPGPRTPPAVTELAISRSALAALLVSADRPAEARLVLEASLEDLYAARAGWPRWDLIGMTQQQLAEVCDKLGDKAGADKARAAAKDAWGATDRPGGMGGGKKDGPRPKN